MSFLQTMEFEKASINTTLSDYSEASVVTLAPSIQYDDSAETSPLLPGSVVVQNTTESGKYLWFKVNHLKDGMSKKFV